jgi:hypothetical protein
MPKKQLAVPLSRNMVRMIYYHPINVSKWIFRGAFFLFRQSASNSCNGRNLLRWKLICKIFIFLIFCILGFWVGGLIFVFAWLDWVLQCNKYGVVYGAILRWPGLRRNTARFRAVYGEVTAKNTVIRNDRPESSSALTGKLKIFSKRYAFFSAVSWKFKEFEVK